MSRARKKQKYEEQLQAAARAALELGLAKPGHFYVIDVMHDDWCSIYKDSRTCDCNPQVGGLVEVTEDELAEVMAQEFSRFARQARPALPSEGAPSGQPDER